MSEEQQRVIDRIKRRRNLLVQQAKPISPRPANTAAVLQTKRDEWKIAKEAMLRFLTGSGDLPEPVKAEVTLFEGSFYPMGKQIEEGFRKCAL